MEDYLLGIDGGGSKTEAILCRADGVCAARVCLSGCNPNDIGFSAAADVVLSAARLVREGCTGKVVSLCAGIAGISTGDHLVRLRQLLSDAFPHLDIILESDAAIALSNGLLREDGCLLLSGTGVVGLSRRDGQWKRFGGFGYLLDHGGSGYDFGRDLFYAVLCRAEGRGPETLLTSLLEERLGCPAKEALPIVYRLGRSYLAAFAPLVFQAAERQDKVALDIVKKNGEELGKLVSVLLADQQRISCPIVLSGGIFHHFTQLEPYLAAAHAGARFLRPATPPVYGAVVDALFALGRDLPAEFATCFLESYRSLLDA